MAMTWYLRILGADPTQQGSYSQFGGSPPSCPGTGKICALFGTITETGIDLDDTELQAQITTALNSGVDQTRVLLRSTN